MRDPKDFPEDTGGAQGYRFNVGDRVHSRLGDGKVVEVDPRCPYPGIYLVQMDRGGQTIRFPERMGVGRNAWSPLTKID